MQKILSNKKIPTIIKLKYFFEKYGFHVSSRLADSLGMRVTSVRLFFIYISFVTAGLWFGVYLTLAFWIKLKDLIRAKRTSVFDL
ncbi:MAG: phage shock protein PspC (stress-responsive transcriptional regulator) [Flavobacterium sp.]|jgi:phage shock protein PspC (stress-responsive transcriptional regulator)